MSLGFCAWYFMNKHWLANNMLGMAFSLEGIEHLSLGSVHVGCILLVGLFFYDIFWVFCTPVMVSVAKVGLWQLASTRIPGPCTVIASSNLLDVLC